MAILLHRKDSMGPANSLRSQEAVWTIAGSMAKISLQCTKIDWAPFLLCQATGLHIGSPTMSLGDGLIVQS